MFGVAGLRGQLAAQDANRKGRAIPAHLSYAVWATTWLVGHVAGGAVTGALLGAAGTLLPAAVILAGPILLAIVCLLGAVRQWKFPQCPLPQWERQVPRSWQQRYSRSWVAFGYGFQLGAAILTRINVATTCAMIIAAILSDDIWTGALLGVLFGAARAVIPIALGPVLDSQEKAFGFSLAFDRYEDLVGRINGGLLFASALLLVATAAIR